MTCTNREKETDWDTFFFEKKSEKTKKLSPAKKIKKIKKCPAIREQGWVALLSGFPSKIEIHIVDDSSLPKVEASR